MNKFLAFLLFFILVVISFSVFNIKDNLPFNKISYVNGKIGDVPIRLEVANNPITRAKGLSGRSELKNGEGMIFIFLEDDTPGFWMKDMKFPIDIIWVNSNQIIIGVEQNISPNTFPASFYPPSPIKYVIETQAGFFDNNSLKIGNSISLESQNLVLGGTF
jgi:uncharacterized protein